MFVGVVFCFLLLSSWLFLCWLMPWESLLTQVDARMTVTCTQMASEERQRVLFDQLATSTDARNQREKRLIHFVYFVRLSLCRKCHSVFPPSELLRFLSLFSFSVFALYEHRVFVFDAFMYDVRRAGLFYSFLMFFHNVAPASLEHAAVDSHGLSRRNNCFHCSSL